MNVQEPVNVIYQTIISVKSLCFSSIVISTGPYFNEARDAISVATTNITNGADLEKELKKTEDTVNFNMGQ